MQASEKELELGTEGIGGIEDIEAFYLVLYVFYALLSSMPSMPHRSSDITFGMFLLLNVSFNAARSRRTSSSNRAL